MTILCGTQADNYKTEKIKFNNLKNYKHMKKVYKRKIVTNVLVKKNKTLATLLTLVVALAWLSQSAYAQAPEEPCFRFFIGYKFLNLGKYSFSHDTHKDDWFLPNSDVPGSAGITELSLRHFAIGSLGFQTPLSRSFSFASDLGILGGTPRDRHANINDERPPANQAFVYSKISISMFITADLLYHIKRFYIGAETQLAFISVESGWDRYSHDQTQKRFNYFPLSLGPKVGFTIPGNNGGRFIIEGTVLLWHTKSFGIQLGFSLP